MNNVAHFRLPRAKTAPAPKGLGKRARDFWAAVQREYGIDDAAGLELLRQAAELLDRLEQARSLVAKGGLLLRDRDKAARTNPAWRIERDARDQFLAVLRTLNLDVEPVRPGPGRPPGA